MWRRSWAMTCIAKFQSPDEKPAGRTGLVCTDLNNISRYPGPSGESRNFTDQNEQKQRKVKMRVRMNAASTFDLTLRCPPAAAATPSMTDIGRRMRLGGAWTTP